MTHFKNSINTMLHETTRLQALPRCSPSLKGLFLKLTSAREIVTSLETLLNGQQPSVNGLLETRLQAPDITTFQQEPPSILQTSHLPSQVQAYLPRVALPTFGGEVQEYWEFKEAFQSLVGEVYRAPSVYIMQLKSQLKATEAKNMLIGVRNINEA